MPRGRASGAVPGTREESRGCREGGAGAPRGSLAGGDLIFMKCSCLNPKSSAPVTRSCVTPRSHGNCCYFQDPSLAEWHKSFSPFSPLFSGPASSPSASPCRSPPGAGRCGAGGRERGGQSRPRAPSMRAARPHHERAGRGLHQAAAAQRRAHQGTGAAPGREGRRDSGAPPPSAQMPLGAAGPQPAHRAPHHAGAGHLGRAADLPLLPRPPPGLPQVHQGREVGRGCGTPRGRGRTLAPAGAAAPTPFLASRPLANAPRAHEEAFWGGAGKARVERRGAVGKMGSGSRPHPRGRAGKLRAERGPSCGAPSIPGRVPTLPKPARRGRGSAHLSSALSAPCRRAARAPAARQQVGQ